MNQLQRTRTGPRNKISAFDFVTAEELLKTAALVTVPDDQRQRQAFGQLMPHLYVLRNKGCSFEQLTKLLTDVGFKLQPSTVRAYYSELLATRLDLCQARMNEQIALMAAIRKETAGVGVSETADLVQKLMAKERDAAAQRVGTLLGGASQQAPRGIPVLPIDRSAVQESSLVDPVSPARAPSLNRCAR